MLKVFILAVLFAAVVAVEVPASCIATTSKNGNDVFKAFQRLSACKESLILVDRDASCSQKIDGKSTKTLEIRGSSSKIVPARMNLANFASVKISGLTFQGGSDIRALTLFSAPALVENCIFTNNSAGAIDTTSDISVKSSSFTANSGYFGGGINGVKVSVTSSIFTANSAIKDGGGVFGFSVNVDSSNFAANSGQFGGGVSGNSVVVTSSIFVSNIAHQLGGGISGGTTVSVTSSNFEFNSAGLYGGAIYGNSVNDRSCAFESNAAPEGMDVCQWDVKAQQCNFKPKSL
eukprot:TRINITY_DN7993_c0_g1_i1.p1 TRINITY_DN7993_c0_g1~~TRINITY_DN7993_c0_g1_i1.p1  ORF type:complete len:290 (+),score=79.71 TRINITY_DN7993_c0_g1_i1:52-921(+)